MVKDVYIFSNSVGILIEPTVWTPVTENQRLQWVKERGVWRLSV